MPPSPSQPDGGEERSVAVRFCGEASPIIAGRVNGRSLRFLIDTGSKVSLLRESAFHEITGGLDVLPRCHEFARTRLAGITGEELGTRGCYNVPFEIGRTKFSHPCFVCTDNANIPVAGIIGQDLLRMHGINLLTTRAVVTLNGEDIPILNWSASSPQGDHIGEAPVFLVSKCVVPPRTEVTVLGRVRGGIPGGTQGVVEMTEVEPHGLIGIDTLVRLNERGEVPIRLVNLSLEEISFPKHKRVAIFVEAVDTAEMRSDDAVLGCDRLDEFPRDEFMSLFEISHVSGDESERVSQLLWKYREAFASSRFDLGHCTTIKHRIPTSDAVPVYRRAYRIPFAKRDEMQDQVDALLERGIIEHSTSPWGAPALLVQKPDGSFRFVVDYRDLNKVTRVDPYPLPNIQETIAQLGSAKYFTVVDMASGYWQIEMDENDREKTAFNTPSGHYQWRRMPMGLVNSSAVWQRTADVVLAGLLGRSCHVYLDDVIIYSDNFDQHLADIESVLLRFRAAGLKLKPCKCQFLKPEVKYLGHILSSEGVRPDPGKLNSIHEFPIPRSAREVRQFLGLIGYYRRHVAGFAEKAKPLTRLTSSKSGFAWDNEAQQAFELMKTALTTAPLLKFPDFSKDFVLMTDASGKALGAVLAQDVDGVEHPVAYASRQLNETEQKYGATELECLAVVWAVRHFRCYLYGRQFKVVTDCNSLRWLMTSRDPNSRLARWNLLLQEHNFEIVHRAGKLHQNADALSRAAVRPLFEFRPTLDPQRFREEQNADAALSALICKCKETADMSAEGYVLNQEGLLCWKTSTTEGELGEVRSRVVVPKSMIGEVIRTAHDAPYAGHMGPRKTLERVSRDFFWHGMTRDVQEHCRRCLSCTLGKVPKGRKPAPLQVFEEVSKPFQRTSMDIVGPLPVSTEGNRYLLVFVDHLTRYSEVMPMPNQRAETVARLFVENVVLRHGAPQQLLTDQGTNFTSKLLREVCSLLGIRKLQTTPYHPECNGAVERLNQTIVGMLRHYVSRDQSDWDVWVPYVTFAYNSASHESTRLSPFFLMYGRGPDLPAALYEPPKGSYGTLENYKEELLQRLAAAHDLARESLASSAESRKRVFDRGTQKPKFLVGDLVCVEDTAGIRGLAKKLRMKWRGPFKVVERLSDVTLRIKESRTGEQKIIHANRLRAYRAVGCDEDEIEVRSRAEDFDRGGARGSGSSGRDGGGETVPTAVSGNDDDGPGKMNDLIMFALLEELENAAAAPVSPAAQPRSQGHTYALRSRGAVIN